MGEGKSVFSNVAKLVISATPGAVEQSIKKSIVVVVCVCVRAHTLVFDHSLVVFMLLGVSVLNEKN